jgi:hypothetical protein
LLTVKYNHEPIAPGDAAGASPPELIVGFEIKEWQSAIKQEKYYGVAPGIDVRFARMKSLSMQQSKMTNLW